jgi:hypothetical protein
VRVTLHAPFTAVTKVDLLERELASVPLDDGAAVLHLRPFELVTLRFA